ncbi:MAG: hypothetical protein WD048_01175 [Chitinophagales bacterium]
MKNRFLISIGAAVFSLIIFSQCSKDDDNNNSDNWAAAVAGTYTGTSQVECGPGEPESGSLTFTRTGDKQLTMQGTFGSDTYCLDSLTMNSSTTFTIGEYDGCIAEPATGSGTFTGNSISFLVNYTGWCSFTIQGTK